MLFTHPEMVQAELSYRRERITEDYKRANWRRWARRTAEPVEVRPEPVRVSFESLPEPESHRPAA